MGVGSVGGDLLKQIAKQQQNLIKNKALCLRVVGIANSKKCIFNRNGIEIERYKELLAESETVSSPEYFKEQILQMNIFNAVFVDCTDSAEVAALYYDLLDNNVSVVAANKIATSGSYDSYIRLKETAARRDVNSSSRQTWVQDCLLSTLSMPLSTVATIFCVSRLYSPAHLTSSSIPSANKYP